MRIFLVGLSEGFARSLARYVGGDPRLALAGVAPTLALAGLMLPATLPYLALIDWAALEALPRDALQLLRLACPGLRIVCVVNETEPYRDAAAQLGADAVISMDALAEELEPLLGSYFPDRFATNGANNE